MEFSQRRGESSAERTPLSRKVQCYCLALQLVAAGSFATLVSHGGALKYTAADDVKKEETP